MEKAKVGNKRLREEAVEEDDVDKLATLLTLTCSTFTLAFKHDYNGVIQPALFTTLTGPVA